LAELDGSPIQRGMPEALRAVLMALVLDDGRARAGVIMGSETTLTMVW
jgi:hypothetical protein